MYRFSDRIAYTITEEELLRLEEGVFLNDTIIDFFLHFFLNQNEPMYPRHRNDNDGSNQPPAMNACAIPRVRLMNSFFFRQLSTGTGCGGTLKPVGLFSYDYMVIPVNEWYLLSFLS